MVEFESQTDSKKNQSDLFNKPWLKQIQNSTPTYYKPLRGQDNPPNANLELEHIYGYRCHDTRNNLKFGPDDKSIIYHEAAVGIVLDPETNK